MDGTALLRGAVAVFLLLLHAALVFAAAPVLDGALGRARAMLLGRRGPSPLRAWQDLIACFRKHPVLPEGTSPVFPAAPVVAVGASAAAALLVPSFALGMATGPIADLVVLIGLLATVRMAEALGAFDAGTVPGGMGASRAAVHAVLSDATLVLVLFALALLTGTTNLDATAGAMRDGELSLRVPLLLALVAALLAALADTRCKPVDDPDALLPGGIGVGLRQEHSGPLLALLDYAGSLRLLLWLSLLAAIFLPFGLAPAEGGPLALVTGLLLWPIKLGALLLGLAVLDAGLVRLRLASVPRLLGCAILLALLAAMLLLVGQDLA